MPVLSRSGGFVTATIVAFMAISTAVPMAAAQQGKTRPETEPNNSFATATVVAAGDTVLGESNPNGDVDFFALDLAAGTDLLIDHDSGSQFVGLLDRDTTTYLAYLSYEGPEGRIRILRYRVRASGRYFLRVQFYNLQGSPGNTYRFRVTVTPKPAGAIIAEIEPNNNATAATPADLGNTVTGDIIPWPRSNNTYDWDEDWYELYLEAGTQLQLDLDARVDGSPLDGRVRLFTRSHGEVASNDDYDGVDSHLWYDIPATDHYYVVVSGGLGGPGHFYRLKISTGAAPAPPPAAPPQLPTVAYVAHALLGIPGASLAPAISDYLDQQGNGNGLLDVGDFRAYLKSQGSLPAAAVLRSLPRSSSVTR
jgi:hypothetical protein